MENMHVSNKNYKSIIYMDITPHLSNCNNQEELFNQIFFQQEKPEKAGSLELLEPYWYEAKPCHTDP